MQITPRFCALFAVMLATSLITGVASGQILPGDVVNGLSQPNNTDDGPDMMPGTADDVFVENETLELVRGPAGAGGGVELTDFFNAVEQDFIGSLAFDNLNGFTSNARGNLIGLNFGAGVGGPGVGGGQIFNFATQVSSSPQPQLLASFADIDTDDDGVVDPGSAFGFGSLAPTRISGVSVSPNNDRIALAGFDSGEIIVFDYTAGNTMGGGAALSNPRGSGGFTISGGETQGATFLDNDTLITVDTLGGIIITDITSEGITSNLVDDNTIIPASSDVDFTSIAYDPALSPNIFVSVSDFSGGVTTNSLFVLSTNEAFSEFNLVNTVDLSMSSGTGREIAFDNDGNLFIGTFGGDIDVILDAAANAATIADNSSVEYFATPNFGSFPGLAVARGDETAIVTPDPGDFNGDGVVDVADYTVWRDNLGEAEGDLLNGNGNGGTVDITDYQLWVDNFGTDFNTPQAASAPEPVSLTLLLVGALGLATRRR